MGESYLQRKVFNRMRRIRTHTSTLSAQTNSIDSRWNTTTTQMPSNSFSSPQLNLIRNQLGSDMGDTISSIDDDEIENNITAVNKTSKRPKREAKSGSSVSKLKAASRAVFFFRRANSSAHSSHNRISADGQAASSASHLSSHASADERVSPLANVPQSQQQAKTNHAPSNNTTTSEVPQFIVPKINALKLPLVCLIKSLDGELMREVFVHRYELGQYLIESLKVSVGINDCKYFGLKMAKSFDDQEDLRNVWLDLNESVCKQIKNKANLIYQNCGGAGSSSSNNSLSTTATNQQPSSNTVTNQRSIDFYLRIKFYPPNLSRVQDPFLRNYLWLQLRRDLRLGKLTSSMNNLTLLMACVLQFELGDYSEQLAERIPELNVLPNQDLIEEQAIALWSKRLIGHKRHQAQMQFLRAAVILETYGFDYYPVRDHQRQRAYLLGFNYAGIKTIRNGRIVHHFTWHSLSKISYERRMIIFHIYPTENSKRKQILGFKCLSNEDCQSLYMRLLEQKYFFTVDLAYFDKSIRRPTCLYTSPTQASSADWSSAAADEQAPAMSYSSRFTSCGPSLDANEEHHLISSVSHESANSLEDGSQNSSSSANCCNCEQRPVTTSSEPLTSDGQEVGRNGQSGDGIVQFQAATHLLDNEIVSDHQPTNLTASSLRRTQWHRQRPIGHYGSKTDEDVKHEDAKCWDSIYGPVNNNGREQEPVIRGDSRIWTKMMTCVRNCEPQTSGLVSQRLAEFAESVLIQPWQTAVYFNESNHELRTRSTDSDGFSLRFMMPVFRFCVVIMVLNFLIRWTDSVSGALIELLTITSEPSSYAPQEEGLHQGL